MEKDNGLKPGDIIEFYVKQKEDEKMSKEKPTAPVIVARLCDSWGGRIALLFRTENPYTHYHEDGEEVPYDAIMGWQEVNIQEIESEDERMMNQLHSWMNEFGGAEEYTEKVYQWLKQLIEKQKDQTPVVTGNDYGWIDDLKHDLEHPEELDKKVEEALKQRQKPVECEKHPESKSFEDEWKDYYNNSLINRQPTPNKREIARHFFWFGQKQAEKPVGWSEEDEYKIDVICKLIEHATIIPRSGDDDTGIPPTRLNDKYKGELKAFVKSLRPQSHWKPSKEQIYSLGTVVKGVGENSAGSIAYNLKELYEELKKL